MVGPAGRERTALQPHDSVVFQVEDPVPGAAKSSQFLANTDIAVLGVHFLAAGERIESSGQEHMDSFWFVKVGAVKLHTGDGTHDFAAGDGAMIPMGQGYVFEAEGGTEPTQLVQFAVSEVALPAKMSDVKRDLGLA